MLWAGLVVRYWYIRDTSVMLKTSASYLVELQDILRFYDRLVQIKGTVQFKLLGTLMGSKRGTLFKVPCEHRGTSCHLFPPLHPQPQRKSR
jgi:hypothetical protein